ncbi:MAG: alcohol dehydrogenase catalytic domain-containing protein [Clostridium sp.]|uniref:alcohol dehydrogenase catalytic domain-containing protein n=1 Tax=Enterocloster citroniae TaxID=358743 RepID=UPI001D06510F|nr:alcohol dehydrogenase catalytic domain-containing protein [Enterocloster citroniae]MCB7065248.1 alcohol dehydrogenase catalytic domain-containing protein [Enterocloster citroniae]MCC8083832.1 alcohol dehydrogenase catalytic domain-containing protein [Clostridium sp.]
MRAIVIPEPWKSVTEEREIPARKEGEVLLKMICGGICGSDLASYRGKSAYVSYPRTIGHEFAAQVMEADPNEYGIKPGMIVTGNPYFNCGTCYSCRRGILNCCVHNETMGVQREGAFSDYFTMPVSRLYDGQGIDPQELALIEPFCISYHGVSRASVRPGDKVLVLGAGAIGILAGVAARSFGAEVYISDIAESKVEAAVCDFQLNGGFVNDSPERLVDFVQEITGGDGFDVTIEAVGAPSTFLNCVQAVASRGRVVVIGVAKSSVDFDFLDLQRKELEMYGSRAATTADFYSTMKLVKDGFVDLKKLISRTYSADRAEEAFQDLDQNYETIIKAEFEF